MAKEEKRTITIDDVEHDINEMSQEEQQMVNHIADLDRKISNSIFNLQQLEFGKSAFIKALKESLDAEKQE